MEEIEVPLEQVQEHIHHAAHESGLDAKENWISKVALISALASARLDLPYLFKPCFNSK
jgi:hypothetical protein